MKRAQTKKNAGCWGIASALLVLVGSALAQGPLLVQWKAQRLSVHVDRVALAQVLGEVARQTGIQVDGLDMLQDRVSVRFANLPLREGLEKLLAHRDYAMLGDPSAQDGGQPLTVVVLGRAASPEAADVKRKAARTTGVANQVVLPGGATAPGNALAAEQDPAERAAAVRNLANEGNTDALREAVLDPDPGVQAIAFEALAERDPHEAARLAADASRSNDLSRRLTGLFALGQLDDPIAFAALEQSLADGDDGVREYAVQSLRGQSTPEATLALTHALQDASPAIRILALEALASRGADGREYVRSALQSGDPLLRARAAELLDQASTNEGNEQ